MYRDSERSNVSAFDAILKQYERYRQHRNEKKRQLEAANYAMTIITHYTNVLNTLCNAPPNP